MPNKFVIFPVGKEAEAETYKDWGDAQFRALSGEEDGILGLLNEDAFGQKVTVYFGPPFVYRIEDGEVPEPEDGPAMREAGVLHDDWIRSPDDEE